VQEHLNQKTAKLGVACINIGKFKLGFEMCMELFAKEPVHTNLFANNCNVVINQSGSEFYVGKSPFRQKLISSALEKWGGY